MEGCSWMLLALEKQHTHTWTLISMYREKERSVSTHQGTLVWSDLILPGGHRIINFPDELRWMMLILSSTQHTMIHNRFEQCPIFKTAHSCDDHGKSKTYWPKSWLFFFFFFPLVIPVLVVFKLTVMIASQQSPSISPIRTAEYHLRCTYLLYLATSPVILHNNIKGSPMVSTTFNISSDHGDKSPPTHIPTIADAKNRMFNPSYSCGTMVTLWHTWIFMVMNLVVSHDQPSSNPMWIIVRKRNPTVCIRFEPFRARACSSTHWI